MSAMKFRKRPVIIDAMIYDGENHEEVCAWMDEATGGFTNAWGKDGALVIRTLEGDMAVSPGDYVIKGVQGEFYPCKPDIFDATYDPA